MEKLWVQLLVQLLYNYLNNRYAKGQLTSGGLDTLEMLSEVKGVPLVSKRRKDAQDTLNI